jgi:hypothetical protein
MLKPVKDKIIYSRSKDQVKISAKDLETLANFTLKRACHPLNMTQGLETCLLYLYYSFIANHYPRVNVENHDIANFTP